MYRCGSIRGVRVTVVSVRLTFRSPPRDHLGEEEGFSNAPYLIRHYGVRVVFFVWCEEAILIIVAPPINLLDSVCIPLADRTSVLRGRSKSS